VPSEARARQRSRWLVRVRARARSAASSAARSVAVRRPVEGEGEVVAVDVEAVAVVPDVAAGGVAREEDSKSGPRVRLRAFSIVRQALLEASASLFDEGVGRELVEAEAEPDVVVVGGERITEARRRGRRGLWFVRVVEEDPLVVVSALLLASLVDWLCRLAQDVASPGTWVGERRCSSPASLEGSCLGLAVICRSSGKVSDHDVEASPPLLVVPLSGFGVPEELDRAPEPNMSPEV
jgi:hypothetical protein